MEYGMVIDGSDRDSELCLRATVPLTYAKIDVTLATAHDQHIGSLVGEGQSSVQVRLLQHRHRNKELHGIPMTMEGKLSVGHTTQRHLSMGIGCGGHSTR